MNNQDIIIITAGSAGTWLRERVDPRAWVRMLGEGLVSNYGQKMEVLRAVDDRLYNWTKNLWSLAKEADKALKARRMVDLALVLNEINLRLQKISDFGHEIKSVEEQDLESFERSQNELPSELFSQAGLFSDLKRQWIANKLENQKKRARNAALRTLVDQTKFVVQSVMNILHKMSKDRAYGNINEYLVGLDKIANLQMKFQDKFQPVFNEYLAPLLEEEKELVKEVKPTETESEIEVTHDEPVAEKQETEADPEFDLVTRKKPNLVPDLVPSPEPEAINIIRTKNPSVKELGTQVVPVEEPESLVVEEAEEALEPEHRPEAFEGLPGESSTGLTSTPVIIDVPSMVQGPTKKTKRRKAAMTETEIILMKKAHTDFVVELMKASSTDDPYLLAAMILKYAGQIEDLDLDQSLSLMAIAEGIIDV